MGVLVLARGVASAGAEAVLQHVITLSGFATDTIPVTISSAVTGISSGGVFYGVFQATATGMGGDGVPLDLVSLRLTPSEWESARNSTGPDLPRVHEIRLWFEVPASHPPFELKLQAAMGGSGSPSEDPIGIFINSAAVTDIILPEGVAWTSESWVFLTIPEPVPPLLLAPVLLLLARVGRGPRRARAGAGSQDPVVPNEVEPGRQCEGEELSN